MEEPREEPRKPGIMSWMFQREAAVRNVRTIALDTSSLTKRLQFELDMTISCARLVCFILTIAFVTVALYNQRDLPSEANLNRQIRQEFGFEDLTGTFTSEEDLWEYIDMFADTGRTFMPLSSAYVQSSTDRVLLSKPRKFASASILPLQLGLVSAWSFTVWAQALRTGLEADLVTRKLPAGTTCWAWKYPSSFLYGEHDFGVPAAKECCSFTGVSEEGTGARGSIGASKTYQLLALVFNGSHLQFFAHNSSFLSSSMAHPIATTGISDCLEGQMRIGDRSLRLAQLQFFGRALTVSELEEISRYGQPLEDLVQGREPNQASEEIDDSDYLSMQLQSVEGTLEKKIDDVSSKVEAMQVTNAAGLEIAVKGLLKSSEGRRLAHPAGTDAGSGHAAMSEGRETSDYVEYFSAGQTFQGSLGDKKFVRLSPNSSEVVPYFDHLGKRSFAFTGFVKSRLETPMMEVFFFGGGGTKAIDGCHSFEYGSRSKVNYMFNNNRDRSKPLQEGSSWNGNLFMSEWDLPPSKNDKIEMWRHLAVTVVGVELKLYYDGRLFVTTVMDEPLNDCVDPILRVLATDGLSEKNQSYAKLRFWKRLPSEDEIFQASIDSDFRECRLLDQGEVYDDFSWLTSNGHGCAWYASMVRQRPEMSWCTSEIAAKCPVACQVMTYCHALPKEKHQVFPDVLRFDRDTLCVGRDVDAKHMFEECLNWTAKPKRRRLHYDWKKRIEADFSCSGFLEAYEAGKYCRFDQEGFRKMFGSENSKPTQFTMAFWTRHFPRGYAIGVPGWGGTWASHCKVFPEDFLKYPDGDMVYIDRTGFEFIYDPHGELEWDFSYVPEDSVGKDHDDWLFHAVSYDATDPMDKKWSFLIGRNYAEVIANKGEPTVCSVPEAFTFAMEANGIATGDARLANFRFFNKKMSRGELQHMLYNEQDEFKSAEDRPGPSSPASQMVEYGDLITKSYSNAAAFISPPLITSSRLRQAPCEGPGAVLADQLKSSKNMQILRLQPQCEGPPEFGYEDTCPEATDEVLSCKGTAFSTERFFGIDPSHARDIRDRPLFTEFLYSFSAPLLVRDGTTLFREQYITSLTDWMSLIALPYDTASKTVGVLRVNFWLSGTKHVRPEPQIHLITLVDVENAAFYVGLAAVFVILELLLLMSCAAWARKRSSANTPELDRLRSPWFVVSSAVKCLLPLAFMIARQVELSARISRIDSALQKIIMLSDTGLPSSASAVSVTEQEINLLVAEMNAEAVWRTLTFGFLMFMMYRLLLFFKSHARLAVIVQTLEDCVDSVFHFLLSFASILVMFCITGMYLFGAEREGFKDAGSTAWTVAMMSLGIDWPFSEHGESVSSVIFFFSFILLVSLLMVNALLGIVLAAFDNSKAQAEEELYHQNVVLDVGAVVFRARNSSSIGKLLVGLEKLPKKTLLTPEMLKEILEVPLEMAEAWCFQYASFAGQEEAEAPEEEPPQPSQETPLAAAEKTSQEQTLPDVASRAGVQVSPDDPLSTQLDIRAAAEHTSEDRTLPDVASGAGLQVPPDDPPSTQPDIRAAAEHTSEDRTLPDVVTGAGLQVPPDDPPSTQSNIQAI